MLNPSAFARDAVQCGERNADGMYAFVVTIIPSTPIHLYLWSHEEVVLSRLELLRRRRLVVTGLA
jgi:hypothetical protein